MEQLELRMTTDLETALPAEIVFNFDELEKALAARVEHYNHLVVTEDAIQDAKADRANLRKLREALENSRKETKRKWNLPLATYEERMKKLVARIDAPIASIDGQIKSFEEQEKEQKRSEIAAIYNELVPENFREIIPLDRIFNPKWLNKSTSRKSIEEDIHTLAMRTKVDMVLLYGIDPKYSTAVKAKYMETLDINVALEYRDSLMEAELAFQDTDVQRETIQPPVEKAPPVAVQEPVRAPIKEDRLYSLRLEFQLTQAQSYELKDFLTRTGIKYTKI